MLGSEVIEVAIGIILLFLLVSLICSALQEGLEGILKLRGADLERGIRELLHDPDAKGIVQDFYRHPLIYPLFRGEYHPNERGERPCYIPAGSFASAVLDLVARGKDLPSGAAAQPITPEALRASVDKLQEPALKRVMLSALDTAGNDVNNVKANLEDWFNASMDRVSGWYKHRTQWILFFLGLLAAVVLNIDAITIAQHLTTDKTLRAAVVAEAGRATAAGQPPTSQSFAVARENLARIGYPIGWQTGDDGWPYPIPQACRYEKAASGAAAQGATIAPECSSPGVGTFLQMLIGWLITALATMLGAPFWFDVLNKFMVIRSTVKPREKSQEEGSEDRPNPRSVEVKLVQPAAATS